MAYAFLSSWRLVASAVAARLAATCMATLGLTAHSGSSTVVHASRDVITPSHVRRFSAIVMVIPGISAQIKINQALFKYQLISNSLSLHLAFFYSQASQIFCRNIIMLGHTFKSIGNNETLAP